MSRYFAIVLMSFAVVIGLPANLAADGHRHHPSVEVTFRAVTANSGAHVDMDGVSHYPTVTYVKTNGRAGKAYPRDGVDVTVRVRASSAWTYSATARASTGTHRWYCGETLTGTAPATGAETVTRNYYEQWLPSITLSGTGPVHWVTAEYCALDVSLSDTNVYTSWSKWCDAGSILAFSANTAGAPPKTTTDPHSWLVTRLLEKTITYASDSQKPLVIGIAAVPARVKENIDTSLTLTATAYDSMTGGSAIMAAEYFIGPDPGEGDGTPMNASDGLFDSPAESLTANVDTSAWTRGSYRLSARARDAAGNWSAVVNGQSSMLVECVDGTAPAAVSDLAARPALSLQELPAAIDCSSNAGGAQANLTDHSIVTCWQSVGSILPGDEWVVLDAGGQENIGAVSLAADLWPGLFPRTFTICVSEDGDDWTPVSAVSALKTNGGVYLWQFEPQQARYVKIRGPGVRNPADRRYYWRIAEAAVYRSIGTAVANLTWTAPAETGGGVPASEYDLVCSNSPITSANFDDCLRIPTDAPKAPGQEEDLTVSVPLTGTVYFAIKAADDAANWSQISNVVSAPISVTGFVPESPDDGEQANPAVPQVFRFCVDPDVTNLAIAFSSCAGFPSVPVRRADGQMDRTKTFALDLGVASWVPTLAQWKALKALACAESTLYWRLEGKHPAFGVIFGPARSLYFDCGDITNLHMTVSHENDGDEAIWPDKNSPPVFAWTYTGLQMKYFCIDISKSEAIPLGRPRLTITCNGRGREGNLYALSVAQWKKVRRMAATTGGVLYWRVRGKDSARVLECASAVKKLVLDGGSLEVSQVDLRTDRTITWTHTDAGPVQYVYTFEFSTSEFFLNGGRTITGPPNGLTGNSWTLTDRQLDAVSGLADRNGVSTLYYRVRAEVSGNGFVIYSQPKITNAP